MKYMMFVVVDPDHTEADIEAAPDLASWWSDAQHHGWEAGDRLKPAAEARTVRVRGGKLLVTDGPFAETKEWIAGFDVFECDDLDAAIAQAARHPMAYTGRIEIREFWPIDEH